MQFSREGVNDTLLALDTQGGNEWMEKKGKTSWKTWRDDDTMPMKMEMGLFPTKILCFFIISSTGIRNSEDYFVVYSSGSNYGFSYSYAWALNEWFNKIYKRESD